MRASNSKPKGSSRSLNAEDFLRCNYPFAVRASRVFIRGRYGVFL
jgi:hypothetical protein